MDRVVVMCHEGNSPEEWVSRPLRELGKDENFLEEVLAHSPSLLNLESKRTGVYGPFIPFRQIEFQTPQGRSILPDIVFFSGSGHVVIVEVKLSDNAELKDRRVIAQTVDYAASFSALPEDELATLFMGQRGFQESWPEFIKNLFPDEELWEELADEFLQKMKAGNLHLVIACDQAPPGVEELIKGVATQSSLAFHMELVEVNPFVRPSLDSEILFVPRTKLVTEIVARTAVTVTYREGDVQPSVDIQTTSMEEIEENVRAAKKGERKSRKWSEQETIDGFEKDGDEASKVILNFIRKYSADGKIVADGVRQTPSVGLYVPCKLPDGEVKSYQLMGCTLDWHQIVIYLNQLENSSNKMVRDEFAEKLGEIFGDSFNKTQKEPSLEKTLVHKHMREFEEAIKWVCMMINRHIK